MKKILVTGGLGLIGSHIVMRLLKEGYHVRIFDIRNASDFALGELPVGVEFIKGDIADFKECFFAVGGCEAVFHCAAVARTVETITDPKRAHEVNATGTLNLLEAAKRHGVKRFVYSSSSICNVDVPTPYKVGKQCGENYASVYGKIYGLSTISLRYANVYGPGQRQDGLYPNVLAAFAKQIKEEGKIQIDGSGQQNRSFIHVDDVVEANMLALNEPRAIDGVYDIGTNEYTTIEEIGDWFEEVTGCVVTHGPERKGDIFTIPIRTEFAEFALNFKAKIIFNKEQVKTYL